EAWGRLVRLQDEVLHDDAAAGSERLTAAAQQVEILLGAEHVADGGDEDQVVAFAEAAGTEIAGADVDAVRDARVLDVALGDGLDGGEVQDVGPQGGGGGGESDGIGARPAAYVQHAADVLDAGGAHHQRSAFAGVAVHGGDKGFGPIGAAAGDFVVRDGGAGAYAAGERGPALPQVRGVQQRRAGVVGRGSGEVAGDRRRVAKDAFVLDEEDEGREGVEAHLGSARV